MHFKIYNCFTKPKEVIYRGGKGFKDNMKRNFFSVASSIYSTK